MPESTLFDRPEPEQFQRRWLPTNRYNLMAIQAGRLIRPQPGFSKYYADVLDLRPGYIPLLAEPPGQDVLDYCGRETPQAWPVLLELDLPESLAGKPALAGMIPASHITAVHCRSLEELEEIRQHQYENTVDSLLPFQASPELFTEDGMTLDELRAVLAPLPDVPETLGPAMTITDRLTGGLLAVASHGPREHRFAQFMLTPTERRRDMALSADELGLLASILLGNDTGNKETSLLHTTINVILSATEAELVPAALIERLLAEYELRHGDDHTGLKLLHRLHAIVADPTGTPPRPGSGWPVASGLLLLLLYRNMNRLTGPAPIEALQPDHGALNVARFLAGLARGRQRLDSRYREPDLDQLAAEAEAAALSGMPGWLADWSDVATPTEPPSEEHSAEPEVPEPEGVTVPQFEETPQEDSWLPSPEEAEQAEAMLPASISDEPPVPVEEAAPAGPDTSSWLQQDALDKNHLSAALWLCQARGWQELIRTEVRFRTAVQMESPQKGIVVISGQGVPEISTQVDVLQLRERLTETPLTPEETSTLDHMLVSGEKAPKPRRSRSSGTSRKGKRAVVPPAAEE